MREIKFKAWSKNTKKMYDWNTMKAGHLHGYFDGFYDVELIQYTGVHDDTEDENEIYKGSIIKFTYENDEIIGRVEYESGSYIIVSEELPDGYVPFLEVVDIDGEYWWIPSSKVIGNIYENPELLESEGIE